MSSHLCRGCSCNFADEANLKRHLNASPACRMKKVTSSSFLCRGCSCDFADEANLKRHLNASPACKTKKVTSSSSSNVVAHVPLSKKVHSSSSSAVAGVPNAVVIVPKNGNAPLPSANAMVMSKKVLPGNQLMNGVCGALSSMNLQPVGTPGTKTVFRVQVAQQVPIAVPAASTITKKKINKQVMFVIDESGSMSGNPFREAMNGSKTVLKSLNHDHDWVGIYLFDTNVRCISKPVFLKREGSRLESTIDGLTCNGGGTAIYDAVMTASNAFVKKQGLAIQYELIILTDGADGSSKASKESVNAHLKALKASGGLGTLHVTVLAVGMTSSDRNEMSRMVDGLGEVHDVSSSAGAINDSFIKVVKKGIEKRMQLVTATLTYSC
jgi:hypothetical protein